MIALLLSLACAPSPDSTDAADLSEHHRIDEGTPEALGVMAFLNDADTSFELLDIDVALDARAAGALIDHRDGPDGVFGTADDDPYDTIAEVDDQYYVGASALDKLLDYVEANGWIPEPGDGSGVYEGVVFTAEEAAATLDHANTASEAVLDDDVPLDSRAAGNIVAARPIADMDALAAVSYVGPTALTALRDFAMTAPPPPLGDVGDTCDTSADCAPDLRCLGELAYGSGLFCVDTWDTFSFDEETPIPDDGTELVTSVDVQGLASVPVDVVLTVDVDHARPSDLVLSIDNFNGYGTTLWASDDDPPAEMVVYAFPSDDMVNGLYNVRIVDLVPGVSGTLRGWELYIVSTYD